MLVWMCTEAQGQLSEQCPGCRARPLPRCGTVRAATRARLWCPNWCPSAAFFSTTWSLSRMMGERHPGTPGTAPAHVVPADIWVNPRVGIHQLLGWLAARAALP